MFSHLSNAIAWLYSCLTTRSWLLIAFQTKTKLSLQAPKITKPVCMWPTCIYKNKRGNFVEIIQFSLHWPLNLSVIAFQGHLPLRDCATNHLFHIHSHAYIIFRGWVTLDGRRGGGIKMLEGWECEWGVVKMITRQIDANNARLARNAIRPPRVLRNSWGLTLGGCYFQSIVPAGKYCIVTGLRFFLYN